MLLPSTAPCKRYKYRLKELFIFVFGADAGNMRKQFAEDNKVSLRWVKEEFNYLIQDAGRIPDERLQKYSEFLGIPKESLKNSFYQTLSA